MRILHVNKFVYRRGGAEAYMLDLAAQQRRADHEVELWGMTHPENDAATYAADFPTEIELNPPPITISGRARAVGRMLWSGEAGRCLGRVLDDFRPDVVHFHNVYHQLSPSVLRAASRRGIPTVMTLHDYKLVCPTYLLLANGAPCDACVGGHFQRAIQKRCKDGSLTASALSAAELWLHTTLRAYGPVRRFICPSRFLLEIMERGDVFPDRLRHVPHFTDLPPAGPADAPRAGVLFAGRLSSEKGADVAIEAVGRVPGTHLDLAGDGPERRGLEALAARVAPGRVHFHGRVDRHRVGELLGAAVAVVIPSRVHENQPMVALEAFAAGVPVIGSDLGGIPEVVEHGRTGLVVPAGDVDSLAGAITELTTDPGRASLLGVAARAVAEQRFSAARHLDALDQIYAEAGARVGRLTCAS